MGRISEAIQRFIDRLRSTSNAAPADVAQEEKPGLIEKLPTTARIKPRDWKLNNAFKARPHVPQNTSQRKMMKH